jgi:hypothetical protein
MYFAARHACQVISHRSAQIDACRDINNNAFKLESEVESKVI